MNTVRCFDWSTLDRELLAEMLLISTTDFVNKSYTPTALTKRVRHQFNFFQVPIKFATTKSPETKLKEVWVGGLYDSGLDQDGQAAITIRLQYNTDAKKITLTKKNFKRIALGIADTLLHEVIHTRQYRRRNYKEIVGYTSTAEFSKQIKEQTYLGHSDEIDAYAFNIACALSDKFNKDHEKIVQYLNADLKDKRFKKNGYTMYLETFDHDHRHRVIKKLKKKIMYYLPYTTLGKPYKTSDWLK
jgi:hypothetical protein